MWASWIVALLISPLAVMWGLWFLFAVASLIPGRSQRGTLAAEGSRIDILIPAHNEEVMLPALLASLQQQTSLGLSHLGRILVIADHCSDRTAAVAYEVAGSRVDVLERATGPRGKPAALRDGIAWLTSAAGGTDLRHRAVMIVDADCTLSPNTIETMATGLNAGQLVLQAAYRLRENRGNSAAVMQAPAAIAFALKNIVRPRGMARLSLPTQLFGTGMTFRADVLATVHFRDHLTEDLAISHDLLRDGIYPAFLDEAVVTSPLPAERTSMTTQKLRWETGQIQTWKSLPKMMLSLLRKGRLRGAVALLDWSALPLVMAVLYWTFVAVVAAVLFLCHLVNFWALLSVAGVLLLLVGYVLLGTSREFGLAAVGRLLWATPRFCVWKLALYGQMVAGRGAKGWQRTPRAGEIAAGAQPQE